MKPSAASAPGKVVISGDFAVLHGAPAMVMAVDRRARATVRPVAGDYSEFSAPGLLDGARRFSIGEGKRVQWRDGDDADPLRLVEAVLDQPGILLPESVAIDLDSRAFFDPDSHEKLGLGSSAAATAALVRALTGNDASTADIWQVARSAHRRMQGGVGSGLDVAASCFGGLIRYRQDDTLSPPQLDWPAGLHIRVFYSGSAASTPAAIHLAIRADHDHWRSLIHSAERAAVAWDGGEDAAVVDAMADYTNSLRAFDEATDLGIFSAGHSEMADAAQDKGIVYKPSGAGGGDVGIAIARDPGMLESFTDSAVEIGFVPLEVQRDNTGV